MPQYAQYDPSVAAPSPVIGWYNTDARKYPNLPPASDLLTLTANEWAVHYNNPDGWAVSGGALVRYTAPAPTLTLAQQAGTLLAAGLTVSGTTVPAGVYACDSEAQGKIDRVESYIAKNGTFPGGASTLSWPLATGSVVTIPSTAAFQKLSTAIADFVYGCDEVMLGVSSTLPSATATV